MSTNAALHRAWGLTSSSGQKGQQLRRTTQVQPGGSSSPAIGPPRGKLAGTRALWHYNVSSSSHPLMLPLFALIHPARPRLTQRRSFH